MPQLKGLLEIGHGVYLAGILAAVAGGLSDGAWLAVFGCIAAYILIGLISSYFSFDTCAGNGRKALDLIVNASRALLIATVVIWAIVANVHSHGTTIAEHFVREKMVREAPNLTEFVPGIQKASVVVPRNPGGVSLPLIDAFRMISGSFLTIIWIATGIVFAICGILALASIQIWVFANVLTSPNQAGRTNQQSNTA